MSTKWTPFLLSMLVSFSLLPGTVEACTCRAPDPPAEEFKRTDAVFIGVVTAFTEESERDRKATLAIVKIWKGDFNRVDAIYTVSHGAGCGVYFQVGASYLIYANEDDAGKFQTHVCTRTARLRDAEEDLDYLDGVPSVNIAGNTGCCGGPPSSGDAIMAGCFLWFLFWWRRK
jgi:hypothetical protein